MKSCWIILIAALATGLNAQTSLPPAAATVELPASVLSAGTNTTGTAPADTAADTNAEPLLTRISGDSLQANFKSNIYVFRGNARVNDPQIQIWCDVLTWEQPQPPASVIERGTADGNVRIEAFPAGDTNKVTGAAQTAVYLHDIVGSVTNRTVRLTGNPARVNRTGERGGTVTGTMIEWDLENDSVRVENADASMQPKTGGRTNLFPKIIPTLAP